MPQKVHVLHGRDHREGGPDPIPGIGTGGTIDTSGFVIAQVPGLRKLWAGSHAPISSGAGAVTTVACPLATGSGPAPVANKFYDHLSTPVGTANSGTNTNIGVAVHPNIAGISVSGVQFWRAGTGVFVATVNLWDSVGTLLATATGPSGPGWNEIYFSAPVTLTSVGANYIVSWYTDAAAGGRFTATTPRNWVSAPLSAASGNVTSSAATSSARRATTTSPTAPPTTGDLGEFFVGPIVNYTPAAASALYVVATAAQGTTSGVFIHRCEIGAGVISIYWSAANQTVAAHLVAVGADTGIPSAPTPMSTYDALKATYTTYSAVLSTYPTYTSILHT